MEILFLSLFSCVLVACIVANFSILYALLVGYLIFVIYAIIKKHSILKILRISINGIYNAKNMLIIFILIGMMTALWRAAGTISTIVFYTSELIHPTIFILMTFILNCAVSFLTGTSFGTAATMGVICMTMANTMNLSTSWVGGAILSGAYFGDRCSPVSTSALLISELTETDIFKNIKNMIQTATIPLIATCIIYAIAGICIPHSYGNTNNMQEILGDYFRLGWLTLLPALIILILSVLKVNIKKTMIISIIFATVICLLYQNLNLPTVLKLMIMGYQSSDLQIAQMMNGGGVISMLKVTAIVCISSSYAGIFEETGLLDKLRKYIDILIQKYNLYSIMLFASIVIGIVVCNQTLTIMLVYQICNNCEEKSKEQNEAIANYLENTAVVIAPLIPWSIASSVPIKSIEASSICLIFACYLYLIPIWNWTIEKHKQHHELNL